MTAPAVQHAPEVPFGPAPLRGARYVLRGLKLLATPGIRRYVVLPILLNVVLFLGLLTAIVLLHGSFQAWFADWVGTGYGWLGTIAWTLALVLFLVATWQCFVVVSILIGSPFYSAMAIKLEELVTGRTLSEHHGVIPFVRDVLHSITQELRKFAYFLVWIVPLLLLQLVPMINVAASAGLFLFSCWVLTLEAVDFTLANHRIPFARQRRSLRMHFPLCLGFGSTTLFFTVVPLLNFVAVPAAVAGGVLFWIEELRPQLSQPDRRE